jgi:hypothetical protein
MTFVMWYDRGHFKDFVDLALTPPSQAANTAGSPLAPFATSQTPFADAFKSWCMLAVGHWVSTLVPLFTDGVASVETLVRTAFTAKMASMSGELMMFAPMVTGVIGSGIMKCYQHYQQTQLTRSDASGEESWLTLVPASERKWWSDTIALDEKRQSSMMATQEALQAAQDVASQLPGDLAHRWKALESKKASSGEHKFSLAAIAAQAGGASSSSSSSSSDIRAQAPSSYAYRSGTTGLFKRQRLGAAIGGGATSGMRKDASGLEERDDDTTSDTKQMSVGERLGDGLARALKSAINSTLSSSMTPETKADYERKTNGTLPRLTKQSALIIVRFTHCDANVDIWCT